jgi:REP element-mobilizing transposase RayT
MARLPRFVIPGQPQPASPLHGRGRFAGSRTSSCGRQFPAQLQSGNNRQTIFAADANYQFFRDALVEAAGRFGLAIHRVVWMTNHIHLLTSPLYADGNAGLNSIWLEPHQQHLALGAIDEDRRVAYRQLFKTITPEDELTTIRDATNKGWALGSDHT